MSYLDTQLPHNLLSCFFQSGYITVKDTLGAGGVKSLMGWAGVTEAGLHDGDEIGTSLHLYSLTHTHK